MEIFDNRRRLSAIKSGSMNHQKNKGKQIYFEEPELQKSFEKFSASVKKLPEKDKKMLISG